MNEEKLITRKFPKKWGYTFGDKKEYVNGLYDFFKYCSVLREDLCDIHRYDRDFFDNDNNSSIKDYIQLFDFYCDKIEKIVFDKKKYDDFMSIYKGYPEGERWAEKVGALDSLIDCDKFVFNKKYINIGLKQEYYEEVSKYAKKIFVLEKLCSSTVKKIWKEQLTERYEKLDLNDPYRMIVKIVFPYSWRNSLNMTSKIKSFDKKRKYQSASLISDKSMFCLFNYYNGKISALLIYDSDPEKIVCSRKIDAYSDEFINNKNPYDEQGYFSEVNLLEKQKFDGREHELYATATQIATPKILLHNGGTYNEVVMREPKVVGVLAPNSKSQQFAQQIAKEHNVPYYGILRRIDMVKN